LLSFYIIGLFFIIILHVYLKSYILGILCVTSVQCELWQITILVHFNLCLIVHQCRPLISNSSLVSSVQDDSLNYMPSISSPSSLVFWHQCNIRHYDEFNNCSHEGSNAAMKSHAAAVLPGHSIASAGQHLHF
jgi:hypothetical protein